MITTGGAWPQVILRGREKVLADVVVRALRLSTSRVTNDVMIMRGFGTSKVSHLLNNICGNVPDCNYLEFGTWCGRSLAAAECGNSGLFVGVDDFSFPKKFEVVDVRSELAKNLAGRNVHLFDSKCLDTTREQLGGPFNVFFYDAEHTEVATAGALTHASHAGLLTTPAIVIVDDFLHPVFGQDVSEGVRIGLRWGNYTLCQQWVLAKSAGYHEGLWIGIVQPRKDRRNG